MIATRPEEIFQEYQKGIDYKSRIGLYETVQQNENFYLGKQWEGVNAPDLDKAGLQCAGAGALLLPLHHCLGRCGGPGEPVRTASRTKGSRSPWMW